MERRQLLHGFLSGGAAIGSGALARSQVTNQPATKGLKLPLLGDGDDTANRAYIRHFVLDRFAETGKKFCMHPHG